jgi:hypothetical protein
MVISTNTGKKAVDDFADRTSNKAHQAWRAATYVENDDSAQIVLSATHALAERLTAAVTYFAAARKNMISGDHQAAEELILRVMDQSEKARKISEQLYAALREERP